MHTLLEKIRQVAVATCYRRQGVVIHRPVEGKHPAIERFGRVIHRVIHLGAAGGGARGGRAGAAREVRHGQQQHGLTSQVPGIGQRAHKHGLRKREADAGSRPLRKDVWFIAALTLYCTIEIYDGLRRMVLDGASTTPSDARL